MTPKRLNKQWLGSAAVFFLRLYWGGAFNYRTSTPEITFPLKGNEVAMELIGSGVCKTMKQNAEAAQKPFDSQYCTELARVATRACIERNPGHPANEIEEYQLGYKIGYCTSKVYLLLQKLETEELEIPNKY